MIRLLLLLLSTLWVGLANRVTDQAVKMYKNHAQIQAFTDQLTRTYVTATKKACSNYSQVKYLEFGSTESTAMPVLITCGIHARQLIASEVCLSWAQHVLSNSHPVLQKMRVTLMYQVNLGRQEVIEDDRCLRDNQNDVDLNRNYPTNFAVTDRDSQNFGGWTPLSQPETQCIDHLATEMKPLAYFDIHSGEFAFIYYQAPGSQQPAVLPILQNLKSTLCKACRVYAPELQITKHGQGFMDLQERLKVKYSSLFEVYGGYDANLSEMDDKCVVVFNPLTRRQFDYFTQRSVSILTRYLQLILEAQQKVQ